MLDPTIVPVLKAQDYATFAKVVGKYRHDIRNKYGNVHLPRQFILRFLKRLPDSFTLLSDTAQPALAIAEDLLALSQRIADSLNDRLWFPYEHELDKLDAEMLARYEQLQQDRAPFDAPVLAALIIELQQYVLPLLDEMAALLGEEEKIMQALKEEAEDDPDVLKTVIMVAGQAEDIEGSFLLFKDFMDVHKLAYDPDSNEWSTK